MQTKVVYSIDTDQVTMGSFANLQEAGDSLQRVGKQHSQGKSGTHSILGERSDSSTLSYQQQPSTSPSNSGVSLWVHTHLEVENPGKLVQCAAYLICAELEANNAALRCAARAETFSPSKSELLANLKRRQTEKRANSAQLPIRPGQSVSQSVPSKVHCACTCL